MEKCYDLPFQKFMLPIFLVLFSGIFTFSVQAQQTDRPFSIELNAGGGLIGNSTTNTAFQPEIGINYMPGSWGVGLNAGLYSYGSGFSADQYRTGYEQYTLAEQNSDQWNAISINVGPRFQKSLSRFISLNLGLDLAMNYQEGPSQTVRFNDPSGELESSGMDTDIVLAQMDGEGAAGWNTAIRPQLQLEFQPGFSDRLSFNVKTGIQHHLSDREITYTERDLSRVRQVDSPFEMHHQFENAPVVQRTESAPRTNFFANAGIKISFGGSRAPGQDYNATRSNKPTSRAEDVGDGDPDSDGDGIDDAIETAQDYNAARSNKPTSRAEDIGDGDPDSDGDGIDDVIETAQDYNSSRPNKPDESDVISFDNISYDGNHTYSCHPGSDEVNTIGPGATYEEYSQFEEECKSLGGVVRGANFLYVQQEARLDINGGMDSDGDGIDDAIETAQDYNSSRSNKPSTRSADVGDEDLDSDDDGIDDGLNKSIPPTSDSNRNGMWFKNCNTGADLDPISQSASFEEFEAWLNECLSYSTGDVGDFPPLSGAYSQFTSLVNWTGRLNLAGTIISAGSVMISSHPDSPIYEGDAVGGENALARTEANDSSEDDFKSAGISSPIYETADAGGDGDGDNNEDPAPVQRYNIQPSSYCVEMGSSALQGKSAEAQDYNATRSNKPTSRAADTGEGDLDSDDDGITDAIETAQDYNSSRSNKPNTVADIGDVDGDGFPDFMKSASFSISKRSARTGRSQNPIHEEGGNMQTNPMYESQEMSFGNGDDMDMDADADGLHLELEIDDMRSRVLEVISRMDSETPSSRADSSNNNAPPGAQVAPSQTKVIVLGVTDNGDIIPLEESKLSEFDFNGAPDSDDDGLMDGIESATYSISKRSARTGRSESQGNPLEQESGWQETPALDVAQPNNVYQWTYKLNELSDGEEMPGNGTLTVLFTGGQWHFDVQFDPVDMDDDDDGLAEMLQNSTFSISKRSARK